MNTPHFARVTLLVTCLSPLGCALTSKADALSPRYFSPEQAPEPSAARAAPERRLELRLGQVSSASHLDERISYRLSSSEVGFYEERRWTELLSGSSERKPKSVQPAPELVEELV
jgi:hypothetical protein